MIEASSGVVLQEMYSLLLFVAQVNSTFWLALMFLREGAPTTAPLIPVMVQPLIGISFPSLPLVNTPKVIIAMDRNIIDNLLLV